MADDSSSLFVEYNHIVKGHLKRTYNAYKIHKKTVWNRFF